MFRITNLVFAEKFTKHFTFTTVNTFSNGAPIAKRIEDLPTERKFLGLIDLGMMKHPMDKFHLFFGERAKRFGDMFYFQPYLGAKKILIIQNSRLMEEVVSKEGALPERGDIGYQMMKKAILEINVTPTLVACDGPAWKRLRDPVSKRFLRPKFISNYIPELGKVAERAVRDIIEMSNRDKSDFDQVRHRLMSWSLSTIYFFLFNRHVESYDLEEIKKLSDAVEISVENVLSNKWNKPHLKYLPSKDWREFTTNLKFVTDFIRNQIKEIGNTDSTVAGNDTFLQYLMNETDFDMETIVGLFFDFTAGAVDTTKLAVQWLWYNLAKNPRVQAKLHEEVTSVVGDSAVITVEHFNKLHYLKMCMKESMRVSPLVAILTRLIKQKDTIGGVQVPKDTLVMANIYSMSTDERYWKVPNEFLPERWEDRSEIDFYSCLPFGTGARMCVGRRLSETKIQLITAHLCKRARIHLQREPIPTFESLLLPRGLHLLFEKREI